MPTLREKMASRPSSPQVPRLERRKDFYTRTIVTGLQEMTAELERLPESATKVAALAAVDRYARRLAAAIERKKREEAEKDKGKSTAFSGATLATESANVLRP